MSTIGTKIKTTKQHTPEEKAVIAAKRAATIKLKRDKSMPKSSQKNIEQPPQGEQPPQSSSEEQHVNDDKLTDEEIAEAHILLRLESQRSISITNIIKQITSERGIDRAYLNYNNYLKSELRNALSSVKNEEFCMVNLKYEMYQIESPKFAEYINGDGEADYVIPGKILVSIADEINNTPKILRSNEDINIGTRTYIVDIGRLPEEDYDYNIIKLLQEQIVSIVGICVIIGYNVLVFGPDKNYSISEYIDSIIAYAPSANKNFQEMTAMSIQNNKMCIYQTYSYFYCDKGSVPTGSFMDEYEKESDEIKKILNEGKLFDFLKIKSIELSIPMCVEFYIPNPHLGFIVYGDKVTEIMTVEEIEKNDKVFLYDCKHVAPRRNVDQINKWPSVKKIFSDHYDKTNKYDEDNKTKVEKSFYLKEAKCPKTNVSYVAAYDFETVPIDEKGTHKPYCVCIKNPDHIGDITIYGDDVVEKFIDYIDSIKTEIYMTKTNAKYSIPQIMMYGFNNSRFDNIFIFDEFLNRNPQTKYIIHNGFKYIQYHNIIFLDLNLYYAGSLKSVAAAFKLEITKDVFPYSFLKSIQDIYYKGPVPAKEWWESESDYNEYKTKNGDMFDMQTYTSYYCMKDVELTLRIAEKHREQCQSEINGKKVDVSGCPTGAGIALGIFAQVFLEETLYSSTTQQQLKEREAYKGGRTEVFKKIFDIDDEKEHKPMSDYDINSSYPYAMTFTMPHKFMRAGYISSKGGGITKTNFVDYWLYKAKSKYIGNDPYVIPNLLIKSGKGDIIATKNTDYAYHWGCELNEAVANGFEITYNEVNEYEGKDTFKSFSKYMYNERLKYKKTNAAKAEFYKLCMNSLYGKTGQKAMINNHICSNASEVTALANNTNIKIVDFDLLESGKVIIKYNTPEDDLCIGSLCRFASSIAAYARCNLSKMIRGLGFKNVYYCDTDSVFTAAEAPESLISQIELGKWKKETDKKTGKLLSIKRAIFLAPKTYTYQTMDDNEPCMKAKGQPSNQLHSEYFDMVASGESVKITNPAMFKRSLTGVKIFPQERTMSAVYNKRIWDENNSYAFDNIEEWAIAKEKWKMERKMKQ